MLCSPRLCTTVPVSIMYAHSTSIKSIPRRKNGTTILLPIPDRHLSVFRQITIILESYSFHHQCITLYSRLDSSLVGIDIASTDEIQFLFPERARVITPKRRVMCGGSRACSNSLCNYARVVSECINVKYNQLMDILIFS